MNTSAIHAARIEFRSPGRGKGRTMYQMNIPRLWEAHRGFRVPQSAHVSESVERNEGEGRSQRSERGLRHCQCLAEGAAKQASWHVSTKNYRVAGKVKEVG